MKDKILKMVFKYINIKGLLVETIDVVLEEAVMNAVTKSTTKIDDAYAPIFYPILEKELLKLVEDKLDLEKLLGLKDEEPTA
jgi:hypothetical protein